MTAPLRLAMIGGGPGSFIGPVHRMAAELDGGIRLVAGAFSSDVDRARVAGATFGIAPERSYADWRQMIAEDREVDLVAVVTPNHLHLPVARAALEAGLHVVSDKPATLTLAEALELRQVVEASGCVYALTYTYTGYSTLRMAREMVADGAIGAVRKLVVEYPQGWLSQPVEHDGSKQAEWRADPARAGLGGCIGDIGVHAFNLAEYVSGQRVVEFVADLSSVVDGRALDDDCNILLRFAGGQSGVLIASQISAGEHNGLRLTVYGENASIRWSHETCDRLTILRGDGRHETLYAGVGLSPAARLPSGHPEGFIEAFANIYRDVAAAIRGERALIDDRVPGIVEGVRSMAFVERAVAASKARAGWTRLEDIA